MKHMAHVGVLNSIVNARKGRRKRQKGFYGVFLSNKCGRCKRNNRNGEGQLLSLVPCRESGKAASQQQRRGLRET